MIVLFIPCNTCSMRGLVPDDGGRPPEHVAGNIKCFVCGGSWFVNKVGHELFWPSAG
jgi:hypothetical protein